MAYQEDDGNAPLLEWFERLVPKAREKCGVRLEHLAEFGHELRRPEAESLRNEIYELRTKYQKVNLRMLYFFHDRTAVVVSHGFSKQQAKVPKREIEIAIQRKAAFEAVPKAHTYEGEVG